MAKYKVCYSGFAYVEAESAEEAQDSYDNYIYAEETVISCEEVKEFCVSVNDLFDEDGGDLN